MALLPISCPARPSIGHRHVVSYISLYRYVQTVHKAKYICKSYIHTHTHTHTHTRKLCKTHPPIHLSRTPPSFTCLPPSSTPHPLVPAACAQQKEDVFPFLSVPPTSLLPSLSLSPLFSPRKKREKQKQNKRKGAYPSKKKKLIRKAYFNCM